MARTTINDCLEHCTNHFELVTRVTERSRRIMERHITHMEDDSEDKPIVQALREIATSKYSLSLKDMVMNNQQANADDAGGEITPQRQGYQYADV